jgi:Group II intron, maturase-specific domain/Reverse transcriptase (RNA-dependent DNA polymerase)
VSSFGQLDHDHILTMLGSFPARGMVRQWLKAGVLENGRFASTEEGTPQGGVVSPVLLNVALHGMETAAGVRYGRDGYARAGSPVLIRYADDLVVHCHSRQQASEVKARLAVWLAPRGLAFNEDKTRVVTLDEGLDFLGFNVRRYRGKLLIKPSKAAVGRVRERLRTELRSLRGSNAQAVIKRLNPIIRGWAAYYRTQVSSETFSALDHHLWKLTYKWAIFSHANKPSSWVFARYFGTFNKARKDRWVFGDRTSGAYLHRFAWTNIVRHQIVKHQASPDDPAIGDYWAWRRRKAPLPINRTALRLHKVQDGRCAICRATLVTAEDRPQTPREWEQWLATARKTIDVVRDKGTWTRLNPVSSTSAAITATARHLCPPKHHHGLPEPDARKRARPVLRRARRRKAPGLPDDCMRPDMSAVPLASVAMHEPDIGAAIGQSMSPSAVWSAGIRGSRVTRGMRPALPTARGFVAYQSCRHGRPHDCCWAIRKLGGMMAAIRAPCPLSAPMLAATRIAASDPPSPYPRMGERSSAAFRCPLREL